MNEKWIDVEGANLDQALEKACSELGLTREELDYDFDLNHYRGGASTARIFAGRKDPRAAERSEEIENRVKRLLEAQNLDAQVSTRVTLFAVEIQLRAPGPGVADEPFRSFAATLDEELERYVDGRDLRVSLRGFGAGDRFESPHRGRRDSERSHSEDRSDRDANLRMRARSAIKKVMAGNGPVTLEDLNSYERRLVHLVVREHEGVVSHSVGDGIRKDVSIERSNPEV